MILLTSGRPARTAEVTDFLDFGPWPVFNLADFSVVSGAILLAWLLWQEERREKMTPEPTVSPDESRGEIREVMGEEKILGEANILHETKNFDEPNILEKPNILDEWSAS